MINNPGIMGATLKLAYDAELTLAEAQNGEAFSALDPTLPGEMVSGCNFPWDAMDLDPSDIKDGVIYFAYEIGTIENIPLLYEIP